MTRQPKYFRVLRETMAIDRAIQVYNKRHNCKILPVHIKLLLFLEDAIFPVTRHTIFRYLRIIGSTRNYYQIDDLLNELKELNLAKVEVRKDRLLVYSPSWNTRLWLAQIEADARKFRRDKAVARIWKKLQRKYKKLSVNKQSG